MDNWTVDQVGDWLKTNGFENCIQTFIDQDIDGAALMGLYDDDILQLLSVSNEDGTRKNLALRTQRKFRTILEEYRSAVRQQRKTKRKDSISVVSSVNTSQKDNHVEIDSRIYTIESTSSSLKFFRSELICSYLTKYFLKKYNVTCQIPMQDQSDTSMPLDIKLSGGRENVRNVQKDLRAFFIKIETKMFNDKTVDKRVIRWSKHLYSDSIPTILQQIFSDKKKFTIWEKTNLLSGYFVVHYLTGQHKFSTSVESITEILQHEISYVKDLVISNLDKIQPKFRQEFDEFLREKKEQQQQRFRTMAIISCQYPSQTEMKISFFGLKNQVNMAKKQFQMLINKHRMTTIRIGLDSKQREHFIDNYSHQLRNIELDYQNDNVKIQIREDVIHAPQYLTAKIKQLIQSMTSQIRTLVFQYIPNGMILTENDRLQLQILTQHYNCQIDEIQTETKKELIFLPTGNNASTSKYIMKESNQFQSSVSRSKMLSVSTHTIEIHTSYDLTIDVTVVSTIADANREQLNPEYGNGYFESDNQKRILFIQWLLPRSQEGHQRMKAWIKKFISTVFTQIAALCSEDIKTIAFSTTDWETYDQRKQLVEGILHEIQSQLRSEQFSNRSWKILFILDDEQNDFYNEFSSILQSNCDAYEQFFYPVSTTSIILKASGNVNISKCEHAIHNYMKKYLTTIQLTHPFDHEIWNQHTINVFYRFCLEKFVLPRAQAIQSLDLIGSVSAVNEAKEKYQFMTELERQRILAHANMPSVLLSCCSDDQILSRQLAQRLTDEGYLVSIDYSSDIRSKSNTTDLVIICFSFNYSENIDCMKRMEWIIKSTKRFIPVLFTRSLMNQQDYWLQRLVTEERFYISFQQEIRFELKEDINLDYDKLIVELFPCPISDPTLNEEEQSLIEQHHTPSRFTPEQIREKEKLYEQQTQQVLERNQISDDELVDLIRSLDNVLEENYFNEFSSNLRRWLEKARNGPVIKGNLPPFTLTGDYNDAVFLIPSREKEPWWIASAHLEDLDHSSPDLFSEYNYSMVGPWCNYDDTHRFFQQFFDREIQFRERKQEERKEEDCSAQKDEKSNETYVSRYPHFKTTMRKGTTAWDITENREVLEEYERRQKGRKPRKTDQDTSGWIRLIDRSVELISDIKDGKISLTSDEVQGKIGKAEKTEVDRRKREQLDDPNNKIWKNKRLPSRRQEFIQMKIRNTIEWKEFCSKQ